MRRGFLSVIALLSVTFVTAQLNISELGRLTYNESLSDIWGWVDGTGKEYALVGVHDGFSVVDVSNPASPNQVFFESGAQSIWRDIKTWNNHAYVTTEGGGGLLIADLSTLPGNPNLNTTLYTGNNYPFQSAHNLYIDENGICYLFGADYMNGGAIILDLNTDPMNPVEIGLFDNFYLHDGVARGDTLWGSAINIGIQSVIDVSVKSAPVINAIWSTPNDFTHNCWFSDDNKYLFTTDEVSDAYIASYDVSDLNNVTELDRWQSSPGNNIVPHNTHFLNDYLITSYYADGISILDVSKPDNMVEVGNYDTSPLFSGDTYDGCWGAYPWLPSGYILATDQQEGLYILGPNYTRACHLEGMVTDSVCNDALNNVKIEILGSTYSELSVFDGSYKFGTPTPGTYTIQFTKSGYDTLLVPNVTLTAGNLTTINAKLFSSNTVNYSGAVSGISSAMLQGVSVTISNNNNTYNFTTDANGAFSKCNIVGGTYDINLSLWGYQTQCLSNQLIDNVNNFLDVSLIPGYYDDFVSDEGWTTSSVATAGIWERGDPNGTDFQGEESNPEDDVNGDCGDQAYVTGNGGGGVGSDDIDDGTTTLISPSMNLTNYTNPYLSYYSWFFNGGGQGGPVNDWFKVWVTNGTDTVLLETIDETTTMSQWNPKSFRLLDHITPSATTKVLFSASDDNPGHLVEAGVDVFKVIDSLGVSIEESATANSMSVYPNPSKGVFTIQVNKDMLGANLELRNILGEKVIDLNKVNSTAVLVNLSNYESGVYYLHFKPTGTQPEPLKLIKL